MFTHPSFVLLSMTISLIVDFASSQSTCYWPDGSAAPDYAPCSSTAAISMCSYTPHADTCEPNGLILGTNGEYFRDACTDPKWSSPGCVPLCPWNATTYAGLTQCTDGSFCCGASNTTCCSSNQGVFLASNIASIISPTTSTPLPTQSSSVAVKQPSTTETPQPLTTGSIQTSSTESTQSPTTSPSTQSLPASSTKPTTSPTISPSSPNTNSSSDSTANKSSNKNNSLAIGLGAGLGVALLLTLSTALGFGAWFWLKVRRRREEEWSELDGAPVQRYGGAVEREKLNFQVATQGMYGRSGSGGTSVHELHSKSKEGLRYEI